MNANSKSNPATAQAAKTSPNTNEATARPLYRYTICDSIGEIETCDAEGLNQACEIFFKGNHYKVTSCYRGFAVVVDSKNISTSRNEFGIKWQPVQAVNEYDALKAVAKMFPTLIERIKADEYRRQENDEHLTMYQEGDAQLIEDSEQLLANLEAVRKGTQS